MGLARKHCPVGPFILLIGTKCDENGKREVGFDEAEAFARSHGIRYVETSAKENRNVKEVFEAVGKEMLERIDVPKEEPSKKSKSSCSIF